MKRLNRFSGPAARLAAAAVFCLNLAACMPPKPQDLETEQEIEAKLKTLLAVAVTSLRRDEPEQAEAVLELARELRPADARVLDGFGCVYFRQGRMAEARGMFQRAISADRGYSRPYAHLAAIAKQNGDFQAANELLRAALTLNPLNNRARTNYSVLIHGTDPQRSYRELTKAYALTGELE